MEQLNGFELANKPIKVSPVSEKVYETTSAISTLDKDELDRAGVNLGPSGKLALMAKLAESSGIKIPQYTLDALNMANSTVTTPLAASNGSVPSTPIPTQCFMLSNMFDLNE
jgi:hypothetical protein